MSNGATRCDPSVELPHEERQWYVFIAISAAVYVGGIISIVIGRFIHTTLFNRNRRKEELRKKKSPNHEYVENGSSWYITVTNFAGDLESGKNLPGKILVSLKICQNRLHEYDAKSHKWMHFKSKDLNFFTSFG